MSVDGLEKFPSARDVNKISDNPRCETHTVALAAGVDLRAHAESKGETIQRISRIATASGTQLEAYWFANEAAILVEKLTQDGRFTSPPVVRNLRARKPRSRKGLSLRADETDLALQDMQAGALGETLLLHPVLRMSVGGVELLLEPDGLALFSGETHPEPLELKGYPYREGETNPERLRQARRQAAVYAVALRRRHEALSLNAQIAPRATLVFVRSGGRQPHPIHQELLLGEVRDVEMALLQLEAARTSLPALTASGQKAEDIIDTLGTHFIEACLSFCPMARLCRERGRDRGDIGVLGDGPARVLAPAGDLARAIALRDGAAPVPDEDILAERLVALRSQFGQLPEVV